MRVLGIRGPSSSGVDKRFRAFLAGVFPAAAPAEFNQGMMELGALVCRSRNPQCLVCAVRGSCRAAREGTQEVIPRPRRSRSEKIEAVVGIIEKGGRVLIQQRPAEGLLAGLWEFPGGKVEPGEGLTAALRRELREELGVGVENIRRLATVRHAYTRYLVTLHAFTCRIHGPGFEPGPKRKWVSLASIGRYPLPSGSVKIVDILAGRKTSRA
jgi:A/G-specific adenine glycosylase